MYNAQIWVLFMYKNYKDLELHLKRKIAILTEIDTKVKQLKNNIYECYSKGRMIYQCYRLFKSLKTTKKTRDTFNTDNFLLLLIRHISLSYYAYCLRKI